MESATAVTALGKPLSVLTACSGADDGGTLHVNSPVRGAPEPPAQKSTPKSVRPTRITKRDGAVFRFSKLVAHSQAMHEVFAVLLRLAPTPLTITFFGETGTGKDVLARATHEQSTRANGPFVVFDCGAVAPNLAESELFGHERGSFTGAHSAHAGAFERAQGGTLFLDEVGELPLDLQPRLLRALESRSVRRLGGANDRAVDLRVISATHRDLKSLVATGRFREDLYFRLAGAVVAVPPLRDRREDLPLLVPRLLADLGRSDLAVSDSAFEALANRPWRGNVRELKNALACAVAFVDTGMLEPKHLQFLATTEEQCCLERLPLGGQTLEDIERAAIKQTLAQLSGNRTQTAQTLGIALSTLYWKLKRYGL
ncbi:MAG TPA: sigma-54 dependent transcriptional regulator [Polyangiaceae bacterium]|jgi:DNA-binding NtrC family response regulator|nr:sigma-54 dependent transcriptional regulator [Polyangiaceae bacterium]